MRRFKMVALSHGALCGRVLGRRALAAGGQHADCSPVASVAPASGRGGGETVNWTRDIFTCSNSVNTELTPKRLW